MSLVTTDSFTGRAATDVVVAAAEDASEAETTRVEMRGIVPQTTRYASFDNVVDV